MKLTDKYIQKIEPKEKRYTISDERGLYLEIAPNGSKWWRLRYWIDKKEYKMSLGTFPDVKLTDARKKRDILRAEIAQGKNPALDRKAEKKKSVAESKHLFKAIATEWVQKFSSRWSQGHAELTYRRLEMHIFPHLGARPINQIQPFELLEVLRKIEKRGSLEVAKRVRGICSMIYRYAVASDIADRDIAADLQGALTPPPKRHFASITDPKKIGTLLRDLENCQAYYPVYCALQLAPMLFVRPGELRHATWEEFDLAAAEWRLPAHKTKMKTTHIVPLAKQAVVILQSLQELTGSGKYVFPSVRTPSRPMSENTINVALRRIGYSKEEMTGHGFRSMASTLLNEQGWNKDAIERQLGHCERNKVRAAYNYAEFLPERRKMMQAYADYLEELKNGK